MNDTLKKYLKRPQTKEEWFLAAKLGLLLGAFLIVSSAAVVTMFTRASVTTMNESASITPIADASVDSSRPKSNFDDDLVKIEKTKTALLKFDVPSFAGRFITTAKLRIYINNTSHNQIDLKSALSSSWDEKKITYATSPQIDPMVFASIPANAPKGWYTIDISNALKLNTGHLWTIALTEPVGGTDSLHFSSKETKNMPSIVIGVSSISIVPVSPYVSITPSEAPVITSTVTGVVSPKPSIGTPIPSPTRIVTTAPTFTPMPTIVGQATYPSQVLNLTNWKLTLPIGPAESPTEIKQPALATFKLDPWFVVNPTGGVRFRAHVNGTSTSGSDYIRSELREMTNNGKDNASWSSAVGVHTMTIDQAITALPILKPHVVAGQIHDAGDVIVIRLEGPKLFIDIAGADGPVLDPAYTLGKRFAIKFEAMNGKTNVYYGASPATMTLKYTLTKTYSGAYFKAGAYTQSACKGNSEKGIETDCRESNYGEVIIYNVTVTSQ